MGHRLYPLEIVRLPKVEPYVPPMPLALTEKSKKIIANRFFNNKDVVEITVKTRDGESKTYKREEIYVL